MPDNIFGKKLYQQRARAALPILVRQAIVKKRVTYSDLAEELGIPNPRNLNYPLGCIGQSLNELSSEWGLDIPHIESLAVNKMHGVPGEGFDSFLATVNLSYHQLAPSDKSRYLEAYWAKIFAFPWGKVLERFSLQPAKPKLDDLTKRASSGRRGGGGEGSEHLALKQFVMESPHLFGCRKTIEGKSEFGIPSGDRIDVVFESRSKLVGVEVKPAKTSEYDILRGLYQCVKYLAVLEAKQAFEQTNLEIYVFLALGGEFPPNFVGLRNCLGIKVIDKLSMP